MSRDGFPRFLTIKTSDLGFRTPALVLTRVLDVSFTDTISTFGPVAVMIQAFARWSLAYIPFPRAVRISRSGVANPPNLRHVWSHLCVPSNPVSSVIIFFPIPGLPQKLRSLTSWSSSRGTPAGGSKLLLFLPVSWKPANSTKRAVPPY